VLVLSIQESSLPSTYFAVSLEVPLDDSSGRGDRLLDPRAPRPGLQLAGQCARSRAERDDPWRVPATSPCPGVSRARGSRCSGLADGRLSAEEGLGALLPARPSDHEGHARLIRTQDRRGRIMVVKRHRTLLVALLVYVALDLALPMMPGAFVFDPAGSVESARAGRTAFDTIAPPAPAGDLRVVLHGPRLANLTRRAAPVRASSMPGRTVSGRASRSRDAAPPLSEDPA
jgi:hypothetical protein